MTSIPWWVGTIVGCVSLVAMNSLKRSWDLSLTNFALLFPLLCLVQAGYWWGFRAGVSQGATFSQVWFTGSAINAVAAVLVALVFFDRGMRGGDALGVVLVFLGIWLLSVGR